MISDAKKMFSWCSDETILLLPPDCISLHFFYCKRKKSCAEKKGSCGTKKRVLSLYQENSFFASETLL